MKDQELLNLKIVKIRKNNQNQNQVYLMSTIKSKIKISNFLNIFKKIKFKTINMIVKILEFYKIKKNKNLSID